MGSFVFFYNVHSFVTSSYRQVLCFLVKNILFIFLKQEVFFTLCPLLSEVLRSLKQRLLSCTHARTQRQTRTHMRALELRRLKHVYGVRSSLSLSLFPSMWMCAHMRSHLEYLGAT